MLFSKSWPHRHLVLWLLSPSQVLVNFPFHLLSHLTFKTKSFRSTEREGKAVGDSLLTRLGERGDDLIERIQTSQDSVVEAIDAHGDRVATRLADASEFARSAVGIRKLKTWSPL